jgi:hypothetical protein
VEELERGGSVVRFLVLKDIQHRYTRPAGFPASIQFMESLAVRQASALTAVSGSP